MNFSASNSSNRHALGSKKKKNKKKKQKTKTKTMISSSIAILCGLLLSIVNAQMPVGQCNTDGDTESCCLNGIPGAQLCANVTWVPAQQAIKTVISLGQLQLLGYTFTPNNTKACGGMPAQAQVCAQMQNFTVTSSGCCGCLFIDLTIASIINIQETVGCFAFGTLQSCPGVQCQNFGTCSSCTTQPQCGYCADSTGQNGACDVGTQKGPVTTTCAAPNNWIFHHNQCPATSNIVRKRGLTITQLK
jgi:hypothetical protein